MAFLLGTALSVFQNSGDPNANWAHFERGKKPQGGPRIVGDQRVGVAGDFWNRYAEDIARAKALGCNAFRLSIEWSRLEPAQGKLDQAAFDRYREILACIRAHDMQVMATLHHFVHPQWFEELGAFEREENLEHFVRHCERAFDAFHADVDLWGTINEPTILSMMGYVLGVHAPGRLFQLRRAAEVLANLMRAHVRVYRAIKARPHGFAAQVGIVHSRVPFEPLSRRYPQAVLLSRFLNHMIGDETVLRFFETGRFRMRVPSGVVEYHDEAPLDFIGVNYYSRVAIGKNLEPTSRLGEPMTDMPYGIFPEGLYDAIVRVSRIGVPVYVTENGISDAVDDRRGYFIRSYLAQLERALRDGYDVRGYFYWTLVDNFEWDQGYTQKFGLYELDHDTQARRLRHGSEALRSGYARLNSLLGER